jgi:hypothetical protein
MANKYDADLYLKYNNYGYSDKSISDVKTYSANQTLPLSLNTSQKRTRFKQEWDKDWEVRSNKLVYTPLNLTVFPHGERNTVLKTIYEDIKQGVGQGIDLFYKRIRDKYLNIRRNDVGTFLKNQKVYQTTRPQNHIINKPILALSPNERWAGNEPVTRHSPVPVSYPGAFCLWGSKLIQKEAFTDFASQEFMQSIRNNTTFASYYHSDTSISSEIF